MQCFKSVKLYKVVMSFLFLCSVFFSFIPLMISCEGFNLFAIALDPEEILKNGKIEDFIYSLYREVDVKKTMKNATKRENIIKELDNLIQSSTGEDRIMYKMAKISVLSKFTDLNILMSSKGGSVINVITNGGVFGSDNPVGIINDLYADIGDKHSRSSFENAKKAYDLFNDIGNEIKRNGYSYPEALDDIRGDFLEQAILVSIPVQLIENIILYEPGSLKERDNPPYEDKLNAIMNFINVQEGFLFLEFRFSSNINLAEDILGPIEDPTGIYYFLEAGEYQDIIPLFREI